MGQELILNKSIAIIGGGPAGSICAKFLGDCGFDITLFEKGKFLNTLLPTGGGKCNLANAQYDFKELAKNYPRGEKFLYSVFSQFSTQDTIDFFEKIGVKTYTREDLRIFPVSNSASDVRRKIIDSITNVKFANETVNSLEYSDNFYKIKTNKSSYAFDIVVVAIGGHAGLELLKNLDINTIEQTPALTGYNTKEDFSAISGVGVKNVKYKNYCNDILFTHKGVSGPLVYQISSINARKDLKSINLQLIEEFDFQELLNKNPHKEIKNLLGQILPKSLAKHILNGLNINEETPCHTINAQLRNKIYEKLINFEIKIVSKFPDGEVVTCGGVDLKEINPKTLESKKYKNLYFCGEILDIDGLCGGFNLQNCWSTGFVVAQSIKKNVT